MRELMLTVKNETGLHSRPADFLVRTARLFKSDINIWKGEKHANAKAIVKVILLNVAKNDQIRITANGDDEEKALEELKNLINNDFKVINDTIKI